MAGRTPYDANKLRQLQVIDRLEVGPVRVEPRRVVASYRVIQGRSSDAIDLSYKYEEDVFDPADPRSQNLAGLITAQVALNYGLFCKEIVFSSPMDRHDQRFLTEMAHNTAREIYVNKLLKPNLFIIGAARELPVVKLDNYLLAELIFEEKLGKTSKDRPPADQRRYGILSSGGKESLLSFGLLKELGMTVDPIFINESGGHWNTALRSYRSFKERVDGTARVWVNSDRVFPWMLRWLPFVRPDRERVRADIYPIRLWTVAVFLFGALPLLLKRGAGKLVIGDEYDTTQRVNHQGIPHYDGLYDQSRYFDQALTRFFRRKGWSVVQLSLLRPLSELLVEKVLFERYPDLLELQVSCHSAHVSGDTVKPCGGCEKCRRVVAMLTALGADPKICGYTEAQIKGCLEKLSGMDLHQEKEGTEQLAYMLSMNKELSGVGIGGAKPRARPEVLKLRFDQERSQMEGLPLDIRQPLYELLLTHTDGAVKRAGRQWIDIDLSREPTLHSPFPFDVPEGPGEGQAARDNDHVLAELTWPRAKTRLREVDVALLPVGAIEQHGPHLPLDTDTFDANHLCLQVAMACSTPRPLVLPAIPYGVSYHHDHFPGTFSVSPKTLSMMVWEIGMSAARQGITKLVIVNGHGGNAPALHFAAQMINRDAQIFTCVDTGETSDTDIDAITETDNDVHAGEVETSTALATRPELVDMSAARSSVPKFSSRYLDFTSKRSVTWYAYTRRISESGTMGDPTRASAEKGQRIWAIMVEHLTRFVSELQSMSLDEIHQRRY